MFRKKDEVSQDEKDREEQYEKLFPKIGRDFVSIRDLEGILGQLGLKIDNSKAVDLAKEYKNNLDKSDTDPKKYNDLVELEEEEKEDKDKEEEKEE